MKLALGAMAANTHPHGREWSTRCDERFCDPRGGRCLPRVHTIYQQLHNYPVGASGKDRAADAHGNKYNITPVRREFLTGLRAVIAVRADAETEDRIRRGLAGSPDATRYGLPFLGDNSFLPDRLEIAPEGEPAFWFVRLAGDAGGPRPHTTRMTIRIDRADMSRTESGLFAPSDSPAADPPDTAWVAVGPEAGAAPAPEASAPSGRKRGGRTK
jgi:CRISPR-associated protein Cas5t